MNDQTTTTLAFSVQLTVVYTNELSAMVLQVMQKQKFRTFEVLNVAYVSVLVFLFSLSTRLTCSVSFLPQAVQ